MTSSSSSPSTIHRYHGHVTGELIWSVVAALGGAAKYLNAMQKNKTPFSLWQLLAKVFISAFSGVTTGHVVQTFSSDINLVFVGVALGGWLGADMLDFIWEIIRSYLKK